MTIGAPILKCDPIQSLSAGVGFKTCFSVLSRFLLETFLSMRDSLNRSCDPDDFYEPDDLDDPYKLGDLDLSSLFANPSYFESSDYAAFFPSTTRFVPLSLRS